MTKKERYTVQEGEEQPFPSPSENSVTEATNAEAEVPDTEAIEKPEAPLTIEQLEKENADLKDQYLRLYADFDNARKRMQRERQQLVQEANEQVLLTTISFMDDFSRALQAAEAAGETELLKGFQLIHQNFLSTLDSKYGLKVMSTVGKEFDPTCHEALSVQEDPEKVGSQVTQEYQPGYVMNNKVLRAAKVQVRMPAKKATESTDTNVSEQNEV